MALMDHKDVTSSELLEKAAPLNGVNTAAQLIYQLVRVEEDGTVIPASEDEVIKVESYFEGETSPQVSDSRMLKDVDGIIYEQNENIDSSGKFLAGDKHVDGLEAERKKLLAQFAFLEALLQKLKEEEQEYRGFPDFTVTSGSEISKYHNAKQEISITIDPNYKSYLNPPKANGSPNTYEKENAFIKEISGNEENGGDMDSPSSTSMHNLRNISNGNSSEINHIYEDEEGEAMNDVYTNLVEKNVSFEKLSIRELHELYQTTFGRHTSVKDKQWLIRRIAKGLRGSLKALDGNSTYTDVGGLHPPVIMLPKPKQSSVSKTGKVATKRALETSFSPHGEVKTSQQKQVAREKPPDIDFSISESKFLEHKKRSPRMPHQFATTSEAEEILNKDQTHSPRDEGKRKRKPTKRYIEELTSSDTRDVVGKVNFLAAKEEKTLPSIPNKHHFNEKYNDFSVEVTDIAFSTGYSNRGRPKKSGNMFLNSCSSERAARLVRKALSVRTSRFSGKSKKSESRAKTKDIASESSRHVKPNISSVTKFVDVKLKCPEVETDVAGKGENHKKHHHPWTLKEVMKLLDGVTHCGVGKWADIKKFSFSATVYRSSTDLKDKWRNLVRASNTHFKMLSQGEHQRKKSASPVPGSVLVRVHELAAQRYQASSTVNFDKSHGRESTADNKKLVWR